jgi:hypothetical protein
MASWGGLRRRSGGGANHTKRRTRETPSSQPTSDFTHPTTNPLSHRHRTSGLPDGPDRPREHRRVDTLIPYGFTSAAASSPRSPPTPKTRSRGTTGRSSTRSSRTGSCRRRGLPARQALHRQVAAAVLRRGRLRGRQPRRAPGPPALPQRACKRIRHANLIERTFGETRRRVKVIGRLPGEQSCLSLVGAVLDRASKGWRGLTMTPKALRLQDLRRELLTHHRVTTATRR